MDSITTALKELEQHGYLTRQRLRYENGQLGDIEYTIHEKPVNAETDGFGLEKRQAPMGMVLNTEPEYAELTYAGETVEVTQTAAGLYDERQKAAVDLHKSLETDELFGIGLGEEFQDISFGLYAASDLTVADRSVVETDVTVTSSDKVLTLSTCTPGGASRFIVMGKLTEADTETE